MLLCGKNCRARCDNLEKNHFPLFSCTTRIRTSSESLHSFSPSSSLSPLATMGNQLRRRGGASRLATLALMLALVAQPHGTSAFSLNHPNARRAQSRDFRLFSSVASAADTGTTGVTGPPAIILDGLTCTHDGGTKYQLDKVSYNLPRGKRIGLVGKNGES